MTLHRAMQCTSGWPSCQPAQVDSCSNWPYLVMGLGLPHQPADHQQLGHSPGGPAQLWLAVQWWVLRHLLVWRLPGLCLWRLLGSVREAVCLQCRRTAADLAV